MPGKCSLGGIVVTINDSMMLLRTGAIAIQNGLYNITSDGCNSKRYSKISCQTLLLCFRRIWCVPLDRYSSRPSNIPKNDLFEHYWLAEKIFQAKCIQCEIF